MLILKIIYCLQLLQKKSGIYIYNESYKNNLIIFDHIQKKMQPANNNKDQGATIIKDQNTELFVEGKARIHTKYIQKNANGEMIQNGVFYNPVQIFNRDFTILVMQAYINMLKQNKGDKFDGVYIIDALSASGLRTIRFLKELSGIKMVYANDISPASHKLMRDNFDLNNLDQDKLKMTMEDANLLLQNQKKNVMFDIIDLDPYGSVVPFIDSSIQSIRDGGLMCITCTDTKVTCGPDLSKCYYYYGTTRARVQHFNQNAIRIVLNTISSAASRHCKYIQPIVSFQADFYLRVFVIVRRGRKQCSESGTKIGNVFNCDSCGNYTYHSHLISKIKKDHYFVPNKFPVSSTHCNNCQERYSLNGPIWLANINNLDFVGRMKTMMETEDFGLQLKTHKKIFGTLHSILQQKQLGNIPLGFNFDLMCKNTKTGSPNRKILYTGLESLGFKVSPSYISPSIYKTNAPITVVYDVIKSWKKKTVPEDKYLANVKNQYSLKILNREISSQPNFDYKSQQKHVKLPHFISLGYNMGPKGKPESRVLNEEQLNEFNQIQAKKKIDEVQAQKKTIQVEVQKNNNKIETKDKDNQIEPKKKVNQTQGRKRESSRLREKKSDK